MSESDNMESTLNGTTNNSNNNMIKPKLNIDAKEFVPGFSPSRNTATNNIPNKAINNVC